MSTSTAHFTGPKQQQAYLAPTRETEDYDQNLIQDLGRRLGCLWDYDRFIANAAGRPTLQDFWRRAKAQEEGTIQQLKKLIG